jgi:hypothetical protein
VVATESGKVVLAFGHVVMRLDADGSPDAAE